MRRMLNLMWRALQGGLLLAALAHPARAEDGGCRPLLFKAQAQLPHSVTRGDFKVWYATQGEHALARQEDTDGNGVPDRVDDLLTQLEAANRFYSEVLALTPPLAQPRYARAEVINVYVLAMQRGNGLAFHEVVQERPARRAAAGPCGLRMYVNRSLSPSHNLTPAHELFHLYQYGYAMFKRAWYLEGMARLAETAFAGPARLQRHVAGATGQPRCEDVWQESYSAVRFWWGLGADDGSDDVPIPAELRALRYHDGSAVFGVERFQRGSIVKPVLEQLRQRSEVLAGQHGLAPYRWPSRMQANALFDPEICGAVEEAL